MQSSSRVITYQTVAKSELPALERKGSVAQALHAPLLSVSISGSGIELASLAGVPVEAPGALLSLLSGRPVERDWQGKAVALGYVSDGGIWLCDLLSWARTYRSLPFDDRYVLLSRLMSLLSPTGLSVVALCEIKRRGLYGEFRRLAEGNGWGLLIHRPRGAGHLVCLVDDDASVPATGCTGGSDA